MAHYYDKIYHELVDYETHCHYLESIFRTHHPGNVKSILDMGCGTGSHAYVFAKMGYQVTGVDTSEEMLEVARRKARRHANPQFYRMDMRKIDIDEKFDATLVLFAGFGYLLKDADLRSFFSSVKRHMKKDSLLIYEFWHDTGVHPDASEPSGYKGWVRIEDKKSKHLLIRLDKNSYDAQTGLDTINFDFYVLDLKKQRVVDSFSEIHTMRTYSIAEMKHLLGENGLIPLTFYRGRIPAPGKASTQALRPASRSDFRVTCVARLVK